MSRCPNCMNELVQDRCSRCGYPAVEVIAVRNALPPETLLLERYELGYALASSQQSIAYIAYDCMRRQPVLVLEFFPKQNAVRKQNAVAAKKHLEMFMDACRRFLTSEQAMPMRLLHTFAENNTAYRVYQLAGNVANAVQEADELLDNPILFRDAEGKPVMAVNSLPIPPLPHTTEWKLSRRLISERTRKKVNRFAVGALAAVAAAAAGVVVFSMNRTYDVTVRVNTQQPIVEAVMDGQPLPSATPGPEGYVEYSMSLKSGTYAFTAENMDKMTAAGTLMVGEESLLEVTIHTPTPAPVVVNANAGQWAYRTDDGKTMMVTAGNAEEITDEMESGQLVAWSLNVKQGRAPQGVQVFLSRDGHELAVNLTNGKAAVELTRGRYELILQDAAWAELSRLPVDVADRGTMTLDAAPYEYYAARLASKPAPDSFYYISGGTTPLRSGDVANLSMWLENEELAALLGDYRQYDVTFETEKGLPTDAQVTINGITWTNASEATFGKGKTELEVVITSSGVVIGSERITVDPVKNSHYMLGQQTVADLEARWKGVDGLAKIGEDCCARIDGVLQSVAPDAWNMLVADTKIFPSKAQYALCDVSLTMPALVVSSLDELCFDGMVLRAAEDTVREFELQASQGEWNLTMLVGGETETRQQNVCVTVNGREYELTALNDDQAEAIEYSEYWPEGLVQRLAGNVEFVSDEGTSETGISAEKWLNYAKRYNMGSFKKDWTLYPVDVVLDNRVNPDLVTVLLDGQIVDLVETSGVQRLDVRAVTGKEHKIVLLLDGEVHPTITLTTGAEEAGVTLLFEEANAWEAALRYASVNDGEPILLAGNPRFLTDERIADVKKHKLVEIDATLTGFNADEKTEWKPMTFALCPLGSTEKISIGTVDNGKINFTATEGEYELWVLRDEVGLYDDRRLDTITVRGSEDISVEQALSALGNEYKVARNEATPIRIDPRIRIDDPAKNTVKIVIADIAELPFLEELQMDDAGWYVPTTGDDVRVQNGDHAISVTLTDPEATEELVTLECTYILSFKDGETTITNVAGMRVDALLSDVADEAQNSMRWWGTDPEALKQLTSGENAWVLAPEAMEDTKQTVKQVYLKYPVGTKNVPVYKSHDIRFVLTVQDDDSAGNLVFPMLHNQEPKDERYQAMYLAEGVEYRLVVQRPLEKPTQFFDLGGIKVVGEDVEVLASENGMEMLSVRTESKDGNPVVELVAGYHGEKYANFAGGRVAVTSTPTPEVTPTPTPEVTPTPEQEVTPTPSAPLETPETPTPVPVNGCSHKGAVWEIEEATCTKPGKETVVCKACGFTNSYPTAQKEHSYTETVTKKSSCGVEGEKTFTCSGCSDSYTEPIPALTHSYTFTVTKEAKCEKKGEKTFTCKNCKDTYTEEIAALKHNYTSEVTKAATCDMAGEETYTCSNCGDLYSKELDKLGHSYTSKVTQEANCGADGVRTYTCGCGDSYTELITERPEHKYTSKIEEQPTCSNGGKEKFTCSVCGNWFIKKLDSTGHAWDNSWIAKPASCGVDGTQIFQCTKCWKTKPVAIPATGMHTQPGKDGRCTVCFTLLPEAN